MKTSKKFLPFLVIVVVSAVMISTSFAQTGKTLDNPKTLPTTKQLPTQTKTSIPSKNPETNPQRQKTLEYETKRSNDKRIIVDNDNNNQKGKNNRGRGYAYGKYSKEEKERLKAEKKAAREQAKAERNRKYNEKRQAFQKRYEARKNNPTKSKTLENRKGR
ncbi:MAG: hypothetical protein JNL36_08870 [Candidatus Kapabacteria bacterium]|nr:hypothetical protein [Candidatus Kapabacteria bacterium]